jgi:hypothetical protein
MMRIGAKKDSLFDVRHQGGRRGKRRVGKGVAYAVGKRCVRRVVGLSMGPLFSLSTTFPSLSTSLALCNDRVPLVFRSSVQSQSAYSVGKIPVVQPVSYKKSRGTNSTCIQCLLAASISTPSIVAEGGGGGWSRCLLVDSTRVVNVSYWTGWALSL